MKFALDVPITGEYSIDKVINLAKEAEDNNWDGFFLWDMLLDSRNPSISTLDPIVTLSAIAASTKKMKLGLMLTPIVRRRPWKLARELVTIDHLSKGRLIIGIGLGFNKEEFSRFGEESDLKIRAEKLDESLEILTKLLQGEEVNFKGKYYTVNEIQFNPLPYQKRHIPIWLGGFWPNKKPYRRGAKYDGMYPGIASPDPANPVDTLKSNNLKNIREYIGKFRENIDDFDLMLYGNISSDYEKEKENLKEWENAGLTWWAQSNDFDSFEEHRERILEGPPKKK